MVVYHLLCPYGHRKNGRFQNSSYDFSLWTQQITMPNDHIFYSLSKQLRVHTTQMKSKDCRSELSWILKILRSWGMPRKTLIFGNGLGMALDPKHFSLTNAMAEIWNDPFAISDVHKDLISQCLGGNGAIPQREDQLDPLHLVISACRTLSSINMSQRMNVHWLCQEGQHFPVAVGM